MTLTNGTATTISRLGSTKSIERLEQIAGLRAYGAGAHLSLPQICVGGDQSAGKSSVLEGISGFPFPRQDGLCTRIPTEIILTHTDGLMTIHAEIIPHSTCPEHRQSDLLAFQRSITDFSLLGDIINEATELMGLKSKGHPDGPAFGRDILRIKVTGPIGLQLTIVDLPGLISVPNEDQTEDDVRAVHDLVDSYLSNERTIILAVVQAGNDIANQSIVQKARTFDKAGRRTVGIITKPDLINKGTEARIAALAKNQDTTKLKLGYFLVKNPTPMELNNNISIEERERAEREFFTTTPWREHALDVDRVGMASLRVYLQRLLDDHIREELPKVKKELEVLIQDVERQLIVLGDARPTTSHIRLFLSRLAMRFYVLTSSALQGDYYAADAKFFDTSHEDDAYIRLRACVHQANTQFSHDLRERGSSVVVVARSDVVMTEDVDEEADQRQVTEEGMKKWIMEVYQRTRGRELPGNYNYVLLMELFHHQSKRWGSIAKAHLANIVAQLEDFMSDAVHYVIMEDHVRREVLARIMPALAKHRIAAETELKQLCRDKDGQPITYNHYYTDNVQKARHDHTRIMIKKALNETSVQDFNQKLHVSNTSIDAEKLLGALQRRVLVDMDEQACSEARAGLDAYYKVARKTFVDNVAVQVVERHLLSNLSNVFSPELVAVMSDDELQSIGGEKEDVLHKRKELAALHEKLLAGFRLL